MMQWNVYYFNNNNKRQRVDVRAIESTNLL